jgi:hypothetical protein
MAPSSSRARTAVSRGGRWVLGAFVLFCLAPTGWARADVLGRSTLFYRIPFLAQLEISGDVSDLLTLTADGTAESAYESGHVDSGTDATLLALNATDAWDLSARLDGDWVCPAGYDKQEGDLQIRITNVPAGTIQNGADAFVPLGDLDLMVLSDDAGAAGNLVEIQTRVLLDWSADVPGGYSIGVTYTLVNHVP